MNETTNRISAWQTDVIVLGTGAAGLSAAVTAVQMGLKVIVLERDSVLGGTSAISGGALWIPGTRQAISGGFKDSRDNVRVYLQHLLGDCYRKDLVEAFVERGPEAVAFLDDHTDLRYLVRTLSPDYYPDLPGAADCGRALKVGEYFDPLRSPPQGMMGLGEMMGNRMDIYHFLRMRKSLRSFLHITRLALRFLLDRISYSRSTRLVIGNAMISVLLKAALDKGAMFNLNAETKLFLTGVARFANDAVV